MNEIVNDPEAIVNVDPDVTAPPVMVPEPTNVPPDDAVHSVQWVYVSVAATDVHVMSESFAIDPADAAPNDTSFRVVFVATDVVPAEPGDAVCSWMYGVATENAVALPTASRVEVAVDEEGPVAM